MNNHCTGTEVGHVNTMKTRGPHFIANARDIMYECSYMALYMYKKCMYVDEMFMYLNNE